MERVTHGADEPKGRDARQAGAGEGAMNHAAEIATLYELLAQQGKALAKTQEQLATLTDQLHASVKLVEEAVRIHGNRMDATGTTLRLHQEVLTGLVVKTQLLTERLDEAASGSGTPAARP